jgi:hypothetical protein
MSQILEIRKAAGALSTQERAELAAFLLGSLDEVHHWVDDDDASLRSEELDSGKISGLTREEFNRACGH